MSRTDARSQYEDALKLGLKYQKKAIEDQADPFLPVLDRILPPSPSISRENLGILDIPSDLIVGTKAEGRTTALAGNFMPILPISSEFAEKWIALCESHLEEGIREPIKCFEYLGKFYVEEGNKRVSVLKSYNSQRIPADVVRLLPGYSDSSEIHLYSEFLVFYRQTKFYGISFNIPGQYAKLLALLGYSEGSVWTEDERRSFSAGFSRFREAFSKISKDAQPATPSEGLLKWLEIFPFKDIKALPMAELLERLKSLWPDIQIQAEDTPIEVKMEPDEKGKGLLEKIFSSSPSHIKSAFIYAFPPERSSWTRAHEQGRLYLEQTLGDKTTAVSYVAKDFDFNAAMEQAVADGAEVIFATTPPMIDACRKIAATYPTVKVLNCSLSSPYAGVRSYYSRIYECKFITGALAGAMAENGKIGYVANYPIFGTPASINAFALGTRLTNPRATVKVVWSCTAGNHLQELVEDGITVISNKEAAITYNPQIVPEWGTYKIGTDGSLSPLATPYWNWGPLYENLIRMILDGSWTDVPSVKAINYWWGIHSGVIDVAFSDDLPYGLRTMAEILRNGIRDNRIDPFFTEVYDQNGVQRNDGTKPLTTEELMTMDWLAENVEGTIPPFYALLPQAQTIVRTLGVYRDQIPPKEKEVPQL